MNGGINSFLLNFSPFPNYIVFHKLQWLPLLFTIVEVGIETHTSSAGTGCSPKFFYIYNVTKLQR